jgi:hypothetical protein
MVGIEIFSYRFNIFLTLVSNSSSVNISKSLVVLKLLNSIPLFLYTNFHLHLDQKSLVIIINHHLLAHGGNANGL